MSFFEELFQFARGGGFERGTPGFGEAGRWSEIFAEIGALLVDYSFSLRFAALVMIRRVIEPAVAAGVQGAIASGARVAKADPLQNLDLSSAMETIHSVPDRPGFPLALPQLFRPHSPW